MSFLRKLFGKKPTESPRPAEPSEPPPDVEKMSAERDVDGLINALSYKHKAEIRKDAAWALYLLKDERAAEPLIQALNDEEGIVRLKVADLLGWLKDTRAVEPLIGILTDKYWDVRQMAISSLGYLDAKQAIDPIIARLKDPAEGVRETAAEVLGKFGAKEAVEPLIAALKDSKFTVRQQAAIALGKIGDAHAVPALCVAIQDEIPLVYESAANALAELGDERAVDPLLAMLNGTGYRRNFAARALARLNATRAIEPLVEMRRLAQGASFEDFDSALRQLGWKPSVGTCRECHKNVPLGALIEVRTEYERLEAENNSWETSEWCNDCIQRGRTAPGCRMEQTEWGWYRKVYDHR